jgi:hypothetical protein
VAPSAVFPPVLVPPSALPVEPPLLGEQPLLLAAQISGLHRYWLGDVQLLLGTKRKHISGPLG